LYTVEVTLNGTSVKGAVDLAVLPSGSAEITLRALHETTDLDPAFGAARQAIASGDATALSSAKGALALIASNPDYSSKRLSANNVLFPPNGYPATYTQVAARFAAVPDDAAFGASLDQITNQVRLIRARIDSISASAITQADLDALTAGSNAYHSMVTQLGALKPGPRGITAAGSQIDMLLSTELSLLLDSITRKSTELLGALAVAAPATIRSAAEPTASLTAESTYDDLKYFVDQAVAIFKNMSGYAAENIVELVASLANDLVNIAINNLINADAPPGIAIDYIAAGSDFSFACPNYPSTYVDGEGFADLLANNKIMVIGCINSEALRSLLSLKPGKDPKAINKLIDDIGKIVENLGLTKIAARPDPDELREGLFGGTQMVFYPGWPRVNQGRLPCVGIVIVYNKAAGTYYSMNINMLASCQ
jgi:hypothetical protein